MCRVLVVEDNPIVREVIQHALAAHGYEVRTAPDGLSGVAAAREERLDAVVLDLKIPGMDGEQVLRTLKQFHPGLPVFVFSARGDFADTIAGLPDADGYFAKSSDLSPLIQAIGRAVR